MDAKPLYVAGNWKNSAKNLEVTYPYNNAVIGKVALGGTTEVEEAIAGAVTAFERTKKLSSKQRYDILTQAVREIESRKEEFARTITLESGKSINDARGEVARCMRSEER